MAPFGHVTLQLQHPERWGEALRARYYQPGQEGGIALTPEVHPRIIRITLPRLGAWGVVEIGPMADG